MMVRELIIELLHHCPMSAEIEVEVWPDPDGGGEILACAINRVVFLATERRATLQIQLPGEETP
jgi:hypothetical protein